MAYKAHTWPGLKNPVYLPDSLKASIQMVHAAGWWESQGSTQQTTYTQHFTGNMNSSAQSERNWAQGGGRAEIGSSGSYQIIVDGKEVIITLPFNKAAGHAANHTGNMTSFASEMAIAGGYEAAFQNAAHVAAGVIVSMGWQVDTSLLQHWNWLRANGTQKHCPSIIRDKGDWSRYVSTVTKNAAAIRKQLAGGETPGPVYAKVSPIKELDNIGSSEGFAPAYVEVNGTMWVWVGDRVKAKVDTPRLQYGSKDSKSVGPDIKAWEELNVDWIAKGDVTVYYTPGGERVRVDDTERVSDAKGGVLDE